MIVFPSAVLVITGPIAVRKHAAALFRREKFIHTQSGYQTLLNQRLAKIVTTVYKVVNRQGVSESLCDLVELRESNYNLRGDKILTLPKVNTTKYGLKSLRYEGANLWNKLPHEYRKADSYKLFKEQISDMDLAGRYMS